MTPFLRHRYNENYERRKPDTVGRCNVYTSYVSLAVLIAGSLIMAMKLDLKMSIIFFAAGLLVSLIMYYVLTKSLPLYKVIQKVLDKVSLVVKENLSGVRVIRAFSKSNHEKERFGDKNDELTKINFRVGSLSALLNPNDICRDEPRNSNFAVFRRKKTYIRASCRRGKNNSTYKLYDTKYFSQ